MLFLLCVIAVGQNRNVNLPYPTFVSTPPSPNTEMSFGKYKKYDESMGPFPDAFEFANQLRLDLISIGVSFVVCVCRAGR